MNYDIRARFNKLRMYIYMLNNTIIFIVIYELVYSTEDENIFGNLQIFWYTSIDFQT